MTNSGGVVIPVINGKFIVDQVLPFTDDVAKAIEDIDNKDPRSGLQVEWPSLGFRKRQWAENDIEVEPGESEVFICDFLLPPDLETVQVYSWFKNEKKRRGNEGIGWALTTLYDFHDDTTSETVREVQQVSGVTQSRG